MKKQIGPIVLIITVLFLIAGVILVPKSGLLKKKEITKEPKVLTVPIDENEEEGEVIKESKLLTVDSILEEVEPIVEWEGSEYSRGTILWNTKDEELKLEGRGYLFGDVIGSKVLKDKHSVLQVYLRDAGFEHNMYNVGSSAPGIERSILKLGSIGCELYIRDDERKGGTDMGLLCLDLPEEVVNVTPEPMSEKKARSIAETSDCVQDGVLKGSAFYNENSKTWWFDLDINKPGCNPACVVYEDETVEINWRCTGLISD
ncbi:hypothetical protein ACFLZP_00575 [Patescibacteria group bacterium]